MSTVTEGDVDSQVREVTDEEVTTYQSQGWALLPGLVGAELTGRLLAHLKEVTGLEQDELSRDDPEAEAVLDRIREQGMDKIFSMPRLQDDMVWEVATSHALGNASARLAGFPAMRILADGVICKLPDWTNEKDVIEGAGKGTYTGATPWHQDFTMPLDRAGGIQFWLALSEITPDMGSMQYLTGSHKEPPLGGVQYAQGQSMETSYPQLWDTYEVSPPLHLQAGDVIAHDSLVVHAAQANTTDRLRWAYHSFRVPTTLLYTGAPFGRFAEYGMNFKVWEPFDHPKCPIVTD